LLALLLSEFWEPFQLDEGFGTLSEAVVEEAGQSNQAVNFPGA